MQTHPRQLALRTPVQTVVLFLSGIGCAAGHHFYYNNLTDEETGGSESQEWVTRIGTALALVTRSTLVASVSIALVQRIWLLLRNEFYSVNTLDSMFSIKGDPLEFCSWEMFTKAPSVYLLGIIVWLLPFAAVLPPGTLSVVSVPRAERHQVPVPIIDFSNPERFLHDISNGGVVAPSLDALTTASAFTMEILPRSPIRPDWTNSSWTSMFYGPAIECAAANDSTRTYIDAIARNATYLGLEKEHGYGVSYFAFSSRDVHVSNTVRFSQNPWDTSEVPFGGASSRSDIFIYGKSVTQGVTRPEVVKNTYIGCSLRNASYTARFNFSNGVQSVSTEPFEYFPYNSALWTLDDPTGGLLKPSSYRAFFSCFLDLLWGNVGMFGEYFQQPNRTRVMETALLGSPDMNMSTMVSQDDPSADDPLYRERTLGRASSAARSRSLEELVEELFTNMTLSLFSASEFLTDAAQSPNTEVVTLLNVNVYRYRARYLVLSYAIAVFVALIGLIIGFVSLYCSGVSMDTNFSTFIRTTRNPELDILAEGQNLGQIPLNSNFGKMKLRFLEISEGWSAFATTGQPIQKDAYVALDENDEADQRSQVSETADRLDERHASEGPAQGGNAIAQPSARYSSSSLPNSLVSDITQSERS